MFLIDLLVAHGQSSSSCVILKYKSSSVCSLNPTTLKSSDTTLQKSLNLSKKLVAGSQLWSVKSFHHLFCHESLCLDCLCLCLTKIIPVSRHSYTELFVSVPARNVHSCIVQKGKLQQGNHWSLFIQSWDSPRMSVYRPYSVRLHRLSQSAMQWH